MGALTTTCRGEHVPPRPNSPPIVVFAQRAILFAIVFLALPSDAANAAAQTNGQLSGNLTLDWVASDRLTYEVDLEPKVLMSKPADDPDWRNVDVTSAVEFSPHGQIDLLAETVIGYTRQTDEVNSFEVTPRVGVRFHLFTRDRVARVRERLPGKRLVLRDLLRVEYRSLRYPGTEEDSATSVRFRNRFELLFPLNKARMSEDGVVYLHADWEAFIPLDDPAERFRSKQRVRSGVGYRRSFNWRFETLMIWTRSRNSVGEDFDTNEICLNVRLKRFF